MSNDSLLHSSLIEELQWRPSVEAAHIGGAAGHGAAALTGQVHYCAAKLSKIERQAFATLDSEVR